MADIKKDKSAPKAKNKAVKVMSKGDCKKVVGGRASLVSGGLAGPEDFQISN